MINNMPTYAQDYSFMVATECNGELWFYGAYADETKAIQVATEIDGVIIRNARC